MTKSELRSFGAIAGLHEFSIKELPAAMVAGGKTDYVLLLPSAPDAATLFAADELTRFFREATGITLPRVSGDHAGKCISLGETALSGGVTLPHEKFGESGCRVVTAGDSYILKGGKYGIACAVYDFLSAVLHFEVFSARTITIDRGVRDLPLYALDITDVPDFRFRAPSHAYIKYDPLLRNRFRMIEPEELIGGEGGPYHNNFNFIPPEKFKAAHPKWYSEDGSQMCYTARGDEGERAALEREAAASIIRYIKENPDIPYIAFNHQDNFDWCGCEACTALKERYDGANSASAAIFLNRVRALIGAWFCSEEGKPYDKGQKLVFFAYHGTNRPPVRYDERTDTFALIDDAVRLGGVIPWFAETNADYTCPLTEGEVNRPVARNLRGWKLLADEILFWTYGTNFDNYLAPYCSFFATPETYRFAREQGAGMLFDECQINVAASTGWEELKGYLNYKLGWNVSEDPAALTRAFFEASYGPAAKQMLAIFREYLARGKAQIAAGFSGWRSEFIDPINKKFWDYGELTRWEREMTAAAEALPNSEEGERIRRNIVLERASVRYLLAEVYAADTPAAELARRREAAASDIRESGIDRFNEKKTIDVLFDKWGVQDRG